MYNTMLTVDMLRHFSLVYMSSGTMKQVRWKIVK